MDDLRCSRCGRLLARVDLRAGSCIEVVCERCKAPNTLRVNAVDTAAKPVIIKK